MLMCVLRITDKHCIRHNYIQQQIEPFIHINEDGKKRLIEAPSEDIKRIQKRIKNELLKCSVPNNVFSGVKGKSYIDNAKLHEGKKYLFKIDITAFFPNISRENVYRFYIDVLQTSPDVANILTDLCTVDVNAYKNSQQSIQEFMKEKHIRHTKHLCTGSPSSPLLSYLVNRNMFDEMQQLCDFNNIKMSIYIDDVAFSSKSFISKQIRNTLLSIVSKYGYRISKKKVSFHKPNEFKKVTGVIIKPDGSLDVPNKLRRKIIRGFNYNHPIEPLNKIQGCLVAARQICNIYPNIYTSVRTLKRQETQNQSLNNI